MHPPPACLQESNPRSDIPLESWAALDDVDLSEELRLRIPMLQCVPAFIRGRVRYAYHVALEETASAYVHDITDQRKERAWKLLVLSWRMLLHRHSAAGRLGKG